MTTKAFAGFVLAAVFSVNLGVAQSAPEEEKKIVSLIQEAYIGGAYNDVDTKAMSQGFHENCVIQDLNSRGLATMSLKQWLIVLDRQKWILKDRWNGRTTADIKVLGLEGRAAVARVEIYNDNVHDLTDFLSLYRFEDGWKITGRIFARHKAPPQVHQKRQDEWEKAISERMQPPEKVMDAIGLRPGMVVGEIGAGNGRYTVHLAKRVGETGKIFANDINAYGLSRIRERCQRDKILNVETILGKEDDPLFPKQSLDMAIMIWVYHELDAPPVTLLKNLKPSLKAGALLVLIEPTDTEINNERAAFGLPAESGRPATLLERIKKEAGEAGFELFRVDTFLPLDYICFLKMKTD